MVYPTALKIETGMGALTDETDPNASDSDGDGLTDGLEDQNADGVVA